MTEEQKAYIEQNVKLIENSEWKTFFEYAPEGTGQLLYEAQVDFLDDVSAISTNMFYYSTITEIDIPRNIDRIDARAFVECNNLSSITIPNSVTSIGEDAFIGCTSIREVHIDNIEAWLNIDFYGCSSHPLYYASAGSLYLNGRVLTSITIPNSVTSIGDWAFYNCIDLKSIVIPNSVTSIGSEAFYGCTNLSSITISDSVERIDDFAFYKCARLENIRFEGTRAQCMRVKYNPNGFKRTLATHIQCIDGQVAL